MAKSSKIAKNEQRKRTVARYAARRAELKEIIRRPDSTEAQREAAPADICGPSASPASTCGAWRTPSNSPG